MKNKLAKEFKSAVENLRAGVQETGAYSKLEKRAKKAFAVTSKKKFMKELDKRLRLLAKELPSMVNDKGFEYLVKMPAKIHFNKGSLSVWRGRREAFDVSYDDLRKLKGVKQLVKMAEQADVKLGVQLFGFGAETPSRELINATAPTAKGDMPWTMKRDLGAFTEINVYVDTKEKFDAEKFPKKLPKPKAP
jgi:hypothetical protein